MCWSNSLPSPRHDYPRSLCCSRGTAKLRASKLPPKQAAEEPVGEPQPTLSAPRSGSRLSYSSPLAARYCGRVGAPEEESSSSQSNVCEENVTHPIWSPTEILLSFPRGNWLSRIPPCTHTHTHTHLEWERHIKLELYDNLEWQLSLVLITLFLLFQAIPAMLPDPGVPKIDEFKWIWESDLYFSKC